MSAPRKNAPTTRGRPFQPGNPGRPKGAKHLVTRAVEALLEGEAEELTRKAIECAKAGDMTALKLCLDRIAPPSRERPVSFELPAITSAADVPAAMAALMQAVATGELVPGEAATLAGVVEKFRSAYELAELERRIAALEEART